MSDLSAFPTSDPRIEFCLSRAPVSAQSRSQTKAEVAHEILAILRPARYLITSDVRLTVKWSISEEERYESDRAPDLDNILKPLIDSLVGPSGILIDDNQVREINCKWRDSYSEQQELTVHIDFLDKAWVPKDGLVFIQFQNSLCLPMPNLSSMEEKLQRFNSYKKSLALRGFLQEAGVHYSNSKVLLPEQRIFHRSRLKGFRVIESNEFVHSIC